MTRPKRTRWGEGRLELLTKLWNEGVLIENIAEVFGMAPEAVRAAARHYKLPRRARGKRLGSPRCRLPAPKPKPMPAIDAKPGWPSRAQLMSGNARIAGR